MTKVTIGNTPMVIKNNPWCETEIGCSNEKYYARAPPWDKRRQGLSALSDRQMQVINEFSRVASRENEPRECKDKNGMARNVCRVKAIGFQMRRGGNGRRSRREPTRRSPERRFVR